MMSSDSNAEDSEFGAGIYKKGHINERAFSYSIRNEHRSRSFGSLAEYGPDGEPLPPQHVNGGGRDGGRGGGRYDDRGGKYLFAISILPCNNSQITFAAYTLADDAFIMKFKWSPWPEISNRKRQTGSKFKGKQACVVTDAPDADHCVAELTDHEGLGKFREKVLNLLSQTGFTNFDLKSSIQSWKTSMLSGEIRI